MSLCHHCGIPLDAGYFDESSIQPAPEPGQEVILARYQLHRNHCGVLMYFAQYTDLYATDPTQVQTPGYQWQIRCNGQPLDPYLSFSHIINPWGISGFPVYLRLEEGCLVELSARRTSVLANKPIAMIGGRVLGRTWYNTEYG